MPTDIKNTGYQNWRELQAQNAAPYSSNQTEVSDWYKQFKQRGIESFGSAPTEQVGRQAAEAGFGTSKYDQGLTSANQLEDLQDVRYQNQPWYDSLANGVVKMLGTAGTTFLSSLVGLPAGAATAISEGRWSGLWDNDVTQALGDVDDWLENNFQNYKSEAQEQNKWWQNMGTMNWWADDVIKNAGFTLGAAASMATGAGALGLMSKALGLVNNVSKGAKIANGFVSALFSATGEGMIEARQGVEERNKLELQKLEDSFAPERNALEMEKDMIDQEYSVTGDFNAYQRKMTDVINRQKELEGRLEAGKQQIEESGREMGNKILLGNQALLTAGNLIQFGKVMTKSFDRARHAAELSSKSVKPSLVRAAKVGEDAAKGYAIKGKNLGKAWALGKGLITEGSEEMNQQWIQSSAGAAYNEKDVNDYWRAKLDPEAYRETTRDLYSLGNTINQGFQDSWGDVDQWEQFVIGGMTGMAGTYMPSKIFNQDKTKALYDPRRYGEWSGGAINELNEFNDQYRKYEENVEDLNKVLQDKNFFTRIQSLAARTYAEGKKQKALEENDKKTWKDEDDKQTVHDIQAFLRAGKLDDLRAIYNDMSGELSDEDVEAIRKNTTREIENEDGTKSYEGPFVDKEGNQIVSNEEIKAEVKHNAEELQRKLDSYLDSVDYINQRTGGQLSKDQEDNLVYLHNMGKESLHRADSIMAGLRQKMPDTFLMKTSKTPEQLAQENVSSDLTFSKNDNTPEGYVEVNTSLMNDHAFTDFFIRELLWGGNIRPEFGETADERARREEEEKELTEEQREERRSNRWKDAINRAKEEAKEQNQTNFDLMVNNFLNNYRKDNRASEAETLDALNEFLGDIKDAAELLQQQGEFEKTLQEYIANPGKVDKAKEKEEAKIEQENKEEEAKSRFGGKSAKEIKRDIDSGDVDYSDLDAFLKDSASGNIDASEEDVTAAKQAKEMQDKQTSLEGYIGNIENPTAAADAKQMAQWVGQSAETPDDITVEALNSFDADSLISPEEAAYMQSQGYDDIQIHAQAEARKQQALNAFYEAMEAWQEDQDKKSVIPTEEEQGEGGSFDFGDTGHDSTPKSPSNQGKDDVIPVAAEVKPEEPVTVSGGDSEAAIKEFKQVQDSVESTNGGTWRNTTRRYGRARGSNGRWYNTQTPYHETLSDKTSLRYRRSKAIFDFLNTPDASGITAFDHVENASEDRIRPNDGIRFRVVSLAQQIFGKEFSALTDKEKKESIVIFMVHEKKNILLGDLPLPELEPRQTDDVIELQKLHDMISDAFIDKNKKEGTIDIMADGKDGLDLKFKNGNPFKGQIFEVKTGFVPNSNERRTLNEINTSEDGSIRPFEIAIKVIEGQINTGYKKPVNAIGSGNVGQPYILVPDASGKSMAVPFVTPAFDAESMRDTMAYNLLTEALSQLEKYSNKEDAKAGKHKEERNRAIDTICSLLQIENVFLDADSKDRVVFKYNNVGEDKKRKFEIPTSGDWKSMLLSSLSGTRMQVSLRHINDNISVGNKTEFYNEVIGEIAHTDLPKGIQHTVGTWFTIRKLSEEGVQKTRQTKYPEGVTQEFTLDSGRKVTISTGNEWRAYDPVTGKLLVGDAEVDLAMAAMQAVNKDATEGNIQVDINGKSRMYDVAGKKFVKQSSPAKTWKTGTDSSAAATSKPQSSGPIDAFDELFGGNWDPGTPEEAEGAGGSNKTTQHSQTTSQPPVETKPVERKMSLEDAEKAAKALKILDPRKTKYAWEAIPESMRVDLMSGKSIELTVNGQTKTLSVNSVQETIKTLQEWNTLAKLNKDSIQASVKPMEKDGITLTRENERKARQWLAKNLPMLSSEERTQFVDKIARGGDNADKMWGSYKAGVVEILRNAPEGTVYHEAFHYVMDMVLSDSERSKVLEIARGAYKVKDNWTAEERLASDFRRYALNENAEGIIGKLKRWFRNIKDRIMRYNRISDATINQLFWKINNGELAQKSRDAESFDRRQQQVLREIRRVRNEKLEWKKLGRDAKSTFKDLGITEDSYQKMSLEEKEQYLRCLI